MSKNLKRIQVRRNGKCIQSFDTLRAAKGYITRLYNSGRVLPDDCLTIYDSVLLMGVNF